MSEEVRAQVNNYLGGAIVKKLRVRVMLDTDPVEASAAQETVALERAPELQTLPDGAAQLEPEMTGMLERSYGHSDGPLLSQQDGEGTVH